MIQTTSGTLLGGRVRYLQPAVGYRTSIEPVLLAAAIPARPGDTVLEAGLGAGAGLLCLSARVPGTRITGVELDPATADLARRNIADNGIEGCAVLTLDVTGPDAPDALGQGRFSHAYANPPWHDAAGTAPAHALRSLAKQAARSGLESWTAALVRMVRTGGTVTLILPANAAFRGTAALRAAGCGGLTLLPLWPKEGRDARLVLMQGRRGSRTMDRVMPGLVLHRPDGGFTNVADAVLRDGGSLDMTRPGQAV